MAKQKRGAWPDRDTNRELPKKLDPDRPMFFTYLCMPIGAALGLVVGVLSSNLFAGTAFGFVLGILAGTKLDAKFPRRKS